MDCDLADGSTWRALRHARTLLSDGAAELAFVERDDGWHCVAGGDTSRARQVVSVAPDAGRGDVAAVAAPAAADARWSVLRLDARGVPAFEHPRGRPVDTAVRTVLRVYVPLLLGAVRARAEGTVFVVGHVTQTLDGRIACVNRSPQWIGNAADRRHAHRMRALCDAVMVGAATALHDDPQLTVRDVEGTSPRRVVLSGCGSVLHARTPLRVFAPPGCTVVTAAGAPPALPQNVDLVTVAPTDGALAPAAILAALAGHGVHSLYLEGGARTLSSFLAASCLHLLQVHVAPIVLGSGLPAFDLPVVESIRAGKSFVMQHATLDGDVLLSCWPPHPT